MRLTPHPWGLFLHRTLFRGESAQSGQAEEGGLDRTHVGGAAWRSDGHHAVVGLTIIGILRYYYWRVGNPYVFI